MAKLYTVRILKIESRAGWMEIMADSASQAKSKAREKARKSKIWNSIMPSRITVIPTEVQEG